ncbi:MAG TPA: putative holin [Variovorax sp.]
MFANLTRLLPWLIVSIFLAVLALFVQSEYPGNVLAVSIYKAHLLSLGGWAGYWLDRGLFPYDRPHEFLLPEQEAASEPVTLPEGTKLLEGVALASPSDYAASMIRRAIIVAAALICVGLGA